MLKKADILTRPTPVRRDAPFHGGGRSERRAEAYSSPYVEALSDARTKLVAFFSILEERRCRETIKSPASGIYFDASKRPSEA
jgi:hypothetical protein